MAVKLHYVKISCTATKLSSDKEQGSIAMWSDNRQNGVNSGHSATPGTSNAQHTKCLGLYSSNLKSVIASSLYNCNFGSTAAFQTIFSNAVSTKTPAAFHITAQRFSL